MSDNGIITKVSAQNFEDTYQKLKDILEGNPNLKIILELDHQANAASVGLALNPTRIILFGNSKLGTPLMRNAQLTGLDLPQKVLVAQGENNIVTVSYNDPMYLKERHYISDQEKILQKISGALDAITEGAIQATE